MRICASSECGMVAFEVIDTDTAPIKRAAVLLLCKSIGHKVKVTAIIGFRFFFIFFTNRHRNVVAGMDLKCLVWLALGVHRGAFSLLLNQTRDRVGRWKWGGASSGIYQYVFDFYSFVSTFWFIGLVHHQAGRIRECITIARIKVSKGPSSCCFKTIKFVYS